MGRNTDISGANGIVAITPSDGSDIPGAYVRAVMAGVAGNINATFADGTTGIFPVLAGQIYPFNITRVLSTSTTATGIVGLR